MKYKYLLENSPVCFAHVDVDKGIVYANSALCNFLGYSLQELTSMRFSEITHPLDVEKDEEHFDRLIGGEISEYRLQKRYIHKSSKILWGDLFVTRLVEEQSENRFCVLATLVDITDLKEKDLVLQKEQANFKAMFMNNPLAMGIYSIETLQVLEVNEAGARLYGYTREELLQLKVDALFDEKQKKKLASRLHQENPMMNEIQLWKVKIKCGEKRWIETASHSINYLGQKARHVIVIDVTQRKKIEIQSKRNAKFERLFNDISFHFVNSSTGAALDYIDHALQKIGKFLKVDRAYVFQISPESKIMNNTHEWCRDGIMPQIGQLQGLKCDDFAWWMGKLDHGKTINISDIEHLTDRATAEYEILKTLNIVSLLVIPMMYNGELTGFVGFDSVISKKVWKDSDINILKSLVDLLSAVLARDFSERNLIKAKERAEESSRLKSSFLNIVSHELTTPLNPIIGFSNLLMEETHDPFVNELAGLINDSGKQLLKLIQDLFDLSFSHGQNINLKHHPILCVDLYGLSKASLEKLLINSGKSKRIKLIASCETLTIHHQVNIDSAKILQVLTILFNNALKFTDKGEIEFGIEIDPERDQLSFFVRDTGVGIEKEQLAIIFEEFRQADDSCSRKFGGLGIGLSIARRLVSIMNGNLQVESEMGIGSTFRVDFYTKIFVLNDDNRNDDRLIDEFSSLNGKTILIVDDNNFIHEMIVSKLRHFSINWLHAFCGEESLEIAKSCCPDFILVDIVMPGMDGLDAIRHLKSIFPKVPIAALTAHTLPRDREKAFNAGCDNIITKPIQTDLLLHVLRKHLFERVVSLK